MGTDKYISNSGQGSTYLDSSLLDSLPSLEILYANECETLTVPKELETSSETYFYRGGQAKWLNFYLAEKRDGQGLSLIKRDGYRSIFEQVEQKTRSHLSVSTVCLTHEPGSGGTTLGMQVLWTFRKSLRCAVLRDSEAKAQDIAHQIIALHKAGGPNNQNTVLLLIDNLPRAEHLLRGLEDSIANSQETGKIPVVIILTCRRVISTENQNKTDITCCTEISEEEKEQLTETEAVILSHGHKSECFHGFNIMRHGFLMEYVRKVISPIMTRVNPLAKNTQLLSILSLLNTYVPGSSLLKSECQAFLGPPDPIHGGPSFEDRMEPFTGLLVSFSRREKLLSDDHVRIAHPLIATYCSQALDRIGLTLDKTTKTLIEKFDMGQEGQNLPMAMNDLLVKRTTGRQFSPLIEYLRHIKPRECELILKSVNEKYPRNAFVLQALARFLYLSKLRDYKQAERYAQQAKRVMLKNSFIADTLGQLHKHHLMKRTPQNFNDQLVIVQKAVHAFEEQWRVAEKEDEVILENGDGAERVSNFFNCSGRLGFMQVASLVATEMRKGLPTQAAYELALMLNARPERVTNNTLRKFSALLTSLRDKVDETFSFFEKFLTYSQKDKDLPDMREKASTCYILYVDIGSEYNDQAADRIRGALRKKTVASFPGLLHCLERENSIQEVTEIARMWKEVASLANSPSDTLCYMLSNVVLSCVDPKSSDILPFAKLISMMRQLLSQEHFLDHEPELYFLFLLLWWPGGNGMTQSLNGSKQMECQNIAALNRYVTELQKAYERCYRKYLRSRNIRPHFFLREGTEYGRLVHWSKVKPLVSASASKKTAESVSWEKSGLLKVQGVVKDRKLYACYGERKVPVSPHSMAQIRSPGSISFYLGFNIRGPVAFNIQYSSTSVQIPSEM